MYVLVGDAESDLHLLHLQQIKPSAHLSFHGRLQLASVLTHVRGSPNFINMSEKLEHDF